MSTAIRKSDVGRTSLSASTLIGDRVVNLKGEDLGKIEDFMLDPEQGRIVELRFFGGPDRRRDGSDSRDLGDDRQARMGPREGLALSRTDRLGQWIGGTMTPITTITRVLV